MRQKGYKPSEETRKKISEVNKGKHPSPETLKKLSESHKGQISWMKGRKHSTESILKMSESHKKQMANPEVRKKMSEVTKRLWNNPEFRKRQIESRKGQHSSPKTEFKKGQTPWIKGRKHAEESRKKMGIKNKGIRRSRNTEFKKGQTPWNLERVYTEEEKMAISKATKKGMAKPKIIEKLRTNTLRMYASGRFPRQTNTKPERQLKEELISRGYKEGIDFIHQFKFMNKFMCDFCFPSQKVIVEVDGDFWHANPNKYSQDKLHKHQLKGIARDKSKNAYITKVDNGSWKLIRFWESEINKDVAKCVDKIEEILVRKV